MIVPGSILLIPPIIVAILLIACICVCVVCCCCYLKVEVDENSSADPEVAPKKDDHPIYQVDFDKVDVSKFVTPEKPEEEEVQLESYRTTKDESSEEIQQQRRNQPPHATYERRPPAPVENEEEPMPTLPPVPAPAPAPAKPQRGSAMFNDGMVDVGDLDTFFT